MAFMLRRLASRAQAVVAVVGAGHLQGIRWGPPAQSAALPLSAWQGSPAAVAPAGALHQQGSARRCSWCASGWGLDFCLAEGEPS